MSYVEIMERVAKVFELVGAAVLVLGFIWSLVVALSAWRRTRQGRAAYQALRETFGGVLLLAIEVLVAADLIQTVAVNASLESVAILGLIVLIRTFLSFSLEIEMEGVVPWRRALIGGRTGGSGSSPGDNAGPSRDGSADQSIATGRGRR
jgi:uncharacterized membrane protein